MTVPRYPTKFSNQAQNNEVVFPKAHFEASFSQPFERPRTRIVGQHYARSLGAAVKLQARWQIRFYLVGANNAKRDELISKLVSFGIGWLHFSDGTRVAASAENQISFDISYSQPQIIPVVVNFETWGDPV